MGNRGDMGIDDNLEQKKGEAKERLGEETGNEELRKEGKADQVSGDLKDKADRAADKVGDAVDALKDKFKKKD